MSNDPQRPLTFKERQQLFNAQINLTAPHNAPPPARSPRLPPRSSVSNGSSHVAPPVLPARNSIIDDTPPALPPSLPPRRPSICVEPGPEVCEETPAAYVHVSQRKNTRKAIRVRKSPTKKRESVSEPPPSPNNDTIKRSPSPTTIKRSRSPTTIKRSRSPTTIKRSPSPTTIKRSRSPTTIKRSPSPTTTKRSPSPSPTTIRRVPTRSAPAPPSRASPSIVRRHPPITTPPPSPNTQRRPPPITTPPPPHHRQSLQPHQMEQPLLPARRHSYDERLELDAAAVLAHLAQNPDHSQNPYQYARPTGPPPKPPANRSPYTVKRNLNPQSASWRDSAFIFPPAINLSTHPKYRDMSLSPRPNRNSRHSSTSPSAPRKGSLLLPGTVPPPIPLSLPPPLHSKCENAGRPLSLGEEQIGLEDDHLSEYEDDDDIYGQIAADLDELDEADFIVVQKDALPVPQQTAKSGFREYWHERKEVVESGILEGDQICKDERARQEAMYEVLTSEQTYKKSLETLEKQFLNDNLFTCYLEEFPEGPEAILCNIHEIISVNKRMLEDLKSLYEGKVTVNSITSIVRSYVEHQFHEYVTYCTNSSDQQHTLSQRRAEDPDFDKFLTEREKALAAQNLQSYLLLPMQRVTRMPLLLSSVLKHTDDNNPDKAPLAALHKEVTSIVGKCNEGVRRSDTRRHMATLEKTCDFTKIKRHLTSFTDKPERLIAKEGVVYILKFKSGKMMGSKIHMWLFTDCLVIGLTDPKNTSKIILTEYSPRQLIKISPHFFPPSSYKKKVEPEKVFHLQLLSPDKKFIIQCQSPNDKNEWIEVLKKKETENDDETIYEDWDVPLVQARHNYEKINDDDLELTEGEICRVLKKYTDGWCFGQRESDGQQGWFPMSFMIEIDSDHAKFREIIRKQQMIDKLVNSEQSAEVFNTMKKT